MRYPSRQSFVLGLARPGSPRGTDLMDSRFAFRKFRVLERFSTSNCYSGRARIWGTPPLVLRCSAVVIAFFRNRSRNPTIQVRAAIPICDRALEIGC